MSKSTPAAPDYKAAAEATGQSSKEVTNIQNFANRPTQITPFGRTDWKTGATIDPATGQRVTNWTQQTTLTPESQAALNSQLAITRARSDIGKGMLDRVTSEYGPTMDWSKFSQGGQQVQGGKYYGDKAGDALYSQFSMRNEPIFQRQQQQMETKLRNQGLNPGDEAYDNQMAGLSQQQNDARTNAGFQAAQMAGAEGSRMQGMDIGAGGFNTQLRQQQIAEEMQKRGFSLNEINGLLNGQQVGMPSMPGFTNAERSATVDYTGAAKDQYSAALDAANAKNQGIANAMQLAGSVGGAAMMSDRRLKTNIKLVGEYRGLNIYAFDYIDGTSSVGFMADEVPEQYTTLTAAGFRKVNYAALMRSI